jgi:putative transcriptional regulator
MSSFIIETMPAAARMELPMSIIVNLDVMMAKRKIGLSELAGRVDLTLANLSILKNNKARAVRFSTLEAICKALDCQPGDLLEFKEDD